LLLTWVPSFTSVTVKVAELTESKVILGLSNLPAVLLTQVIIVSSMLEDKFSPIFGIKIVIHS
jgi:hypothetical protein